MSKLLAQEYELVDIDRLKPHPENPRKGDKQAIARSITSNGFYGTVVVQKSTGFILAGNHRWEAARSEKLKQLPVCWVDVSDAEARRILLADNKTADDAAYNDVELAKLLLDIQTEVGSLEGTGYEPPDMAALFKEISDEILAAVPKEENGGGGGGAGSSELIYRVIVDCESEVQQGELLERFESEGLTCKPLIS